MSSGFRNDDGILLDNVEKTLRARKNAGLEGMVGGLAAIIINTQEDLAGLAAGELIGNRLPDTRLETFVFTCHDLVGNREEGLKQIFTVPSKSTLLVNEYIQRYDGFDGFFTKRNVSRLTEATSRQE